MANQSKVQKKPAAKTIAGPCSTVKIVKKKPGSSAKTLSARGMACSLLQGLQKDAKEESEEGTRDRLKQHQWQKHWDSFPEAVKSNYDNASRAKKTQMVNKLIVRDDKGNYSFDKTSPLLEEINEKYESTYADAGSTAKIRAVMVAECGGETSLD